MGFRIPFNRLIVLIIISISLGNAGEVRFEDSTNSQALSSEDNSLNSTTSKRNSFYSTLKQRIKSWRVWAGVFFVSAAGISYRFWARKPSGNEVVIPNVMPDVSESEEGQAQEPELPQSDEVDIVIPNVMPDVSESEEDKTKGSELPQSDVVDIVIPNVMPDVSESEEGQAQEPELPQSDVIDIVTPNVMPNVSVPEEDQPKESENLQLSIESNPKKKPQLQKLIYEVTSLFNRENASETQRKAAEAFKSTIDLFIQKLEKDVPITLQDLESVSNTVTTDLLWAAPIPDFAVYCLQQTPFYYCLSAAIQANRQKHQALTDADFRKFREQYGARMSEIYPVRTIREFHVNKIELIRKHLEQELKALDVVEPFQAIFQALDHFQVNKVSFEQTGLNLPKLLDNVDMDLWGRRHKFPTLERFHDYQRGVVAVNKEWQAFKPGNTYYPKGFYLEEYGYKSSKSNDGNLMFMLPTPGKRLVLFDNFEQHYYNFVKSLGINQIGEEGQDPFKKWNFIRSELVTNIFNSLAGHMPPLSVEGRFWVIFDYYMIQEDKYKLSQRFPNFKDWHQFLKMELPFGEMMLTKPQVKDIFRKHSLPLDVQKTFAQADGHFKGQPWFKFIQHSLIYGLSGKSEGLPSYYQRYVVKPTEDLFLAEPTWKTVLQQAHNLAKTPEQREVANHLFKCIQPIVDDLKFLHHTSGQAPQLRLTL